MLFFKEILTNVNLQCISRRATNYKLLVYHLELTPRDITDAQKLNSSYGENSDISLTLLEVYDKYKFMAIYIHMYTINCMSLNISDMEKTKRLSTRKR